MDNFLRYLLTAKATLDKLQKYKQIHVVLGNESCDLDSIVSTLVLAYFLKEHVYKDKLDHVVLPVLNLNSEELPLRTEACYVLEEAGISKEYLIFRDDVDLKALQEKYPLVVTLVDHHVLAQRDVFLNGNVIAIFDHRPVDKNFKKTEKMEQVTIEDVGSCSTLVAREMFRNNSNLMNQKIATLLYSTIIYDTIALNPEHGRVRHLDIEVASKLERRFDLPEGHQRLFDYLWRVHGDTDNLTSAQLLLRDLKVVEGIPVPSLPSLVDTFLQRNDSLRAVAEFAAKRQTNLVVLTGLEAANDVKRDVAVYFKTRNAALEVLLNELKTGDAGHLQLEEIQLHVDNIIYFNQKNVKATRKHIIPLIQSAVEKQNQ